MESMTSEDTHMAAAQAHPILRYIRTLAASPGGSLLPDDDLLECYLERRDHEAFAALVERHGPMVLGVCQSVLRHRQDAEDAFQATFLVLARQARSIRRRHDVASWLHGVAYRIARKARVAGARRREREAKAITPAAAGSVDDLSWGEVRAILHAELAALPKRFREPLVLCYLEGLTRDEAARRLGWRATTVKGRLHRGRDMLRRRLERCGLGLAGVLGAAAWSSQAPAAPLSAVLIRATTAAALAYTEVTATTVAAKLAAEALAPVIPAKLKVAAAMLLVVAALAGGMAHLSHQAVESEAAAAAPTPMPEHLMVATDRLGDPLPDGAIARLGTVRFNHGDGLNALYFAADGKTIVSEGNGFVRLWEVRTGKEIGHFAAAKPAFDLRSALSPDGKTMVFLNQAHSGDILQVWDMIQRKAVHLATLPVKRDQMSPSHRNALAPDGRLFAMNLPDAISIHDVATARELWSLPSGGRDEIRAIAFAGPDRFVTADKKQVIRIWEARTGKPVRQFAHGEPVEVLFASPDGRRLATLEHSAFAIGGVLERDVIHVWDLATGTQKQVLAGRPKRWHTNVHFSSRGNLLFASSYSRDGDDLTVWDVETGQRLRELSGAGGTAVAVSPDGGRLAAGGSWFHLSMKTGGFSVQGVRRLAEWGGKFDLWDLKSGRCLSDEDHRGSLAATAFLSPAGDRAVTVGASSITTWDAATGRRLRSVDFPPYPFSDPICSHSADGRYTLTFAGDFEHFQILVWDVVAGRLVQTLRLPSPSTPERSLYLTSAFSHDSALLATGHTGTEDVVHLWDLRTGKEIRSFKQRNLYPGRLFFSLDGKTLVVAGLRVVGLDVASGKELFSWRLKPLPDQSRVRSVVGTVDDDQRTTWRSLTVSADGTVAAGVLTGGEEDPLGRIAVCDGRTGRLLLRWNDSGKPAGWFEQLALSPDARLLASSDVADGNSVHVWEVATGKEIYRFRGHQAEIRSVAFSGNGRRLISASADSTVLVWDLTPPSQMAKPGETEVAALWADLAGDDMRRAHTAVWRLAETPEVSVRFLRERLKPVTEEQVRQIRQNTADLDSDSFVRRDRAFQQLKIQGVAAAAVLREVLANKVSLEVRRRVEQLLQNLENKPLSGAPLQLVRALTVLERAATPEARRLVQVLAEGVADGWLTREAKAVHGRLILRPVSE
jgi:RNA polymerase sigma factor (sigma-70 family)